MAAKDEGGSARKIKRGYYSRNFKQGEADDLLDEAGELDLSSEIAMMRVIIRRVFEQADQCAGPEEWAMTLGSLGAAASRLARLIHTQKQLADGGPDVAAALSQALREVTGEIKR